MRENNIIITELSSHKCGELRKIAEYGEKRRINVIIENHRGLSSNAVWLSEVIKEANNPFVGTLPDFGNFCIKRGPGRSCEEEYDRYQGVKDLMPFAKAVSAKSHVFDENGNEIYTDYMKMMKIVKDSGYKGFVNVEYEGNDLSEDEGVIKTRDLLIKVGNSL